ncbi:MAG: hypothetical protein K2I03_12770 [Lachnospiraceae bacterium]|nr:hypothetical protein [Lachnospiraceae bacterium]
MRKFKNLISVILSLSIIISIPVNADASFGNGNNNAETRNVKILQNDKVCNEGTKEKIYTMAAAMLKSDGTDAADIGIGENISIYNFDADSLFDMYPILNSEGECVLVAQVSEDNNVCVNNDTALYEDILDKTDGKGECIVYIDNGVIYAENENKQIELKDTGFNGNNKNDISEYTYEEKVDEIVTKEDSVSFSKYDELLCGALDTDVQEDDETWEDEDIDFDDLVCGAASGRCNIKKFMKQGNYNLCWAASVATIVNYKKGRNISAKTVANAMKKGYDDGATVAETEKALNKYSLTYKMKSSKISWATIKRRISVNDRPFSIAMASTDGGMGHIITGYGYNSSISGMKMVEYWDSRDIKGCFPYSSKVTIYGTTYYWYATVC